MMVTSIAASAIIDVKIDPANGAVSILSVEDWSVPCAIGWCGAVASHLKREGDGMTPIGTFPLRYGFYRKDRLDHIWPVSRFPFVAIQREDRFAWGDDPADAASYNRLGLSAPDAQHPEALCRAEDGVYDVVVPIGYNDAEPILGHGSAIFLHIAHDDLRPTAGCIALMQSDMMALIARLRPGMLVRITCES
jgi:L,D-peptidoglycan transpeptidase YkuD (ErfK/YbiS/YcfS/YnhG family)